MLSTLFVVDQSTDVLPLANNVVTFETYLQEYPKLGESKLRVINLCDCDRYLSQGYYCSLLAEARDHQVTPSIKVINGLRDGDNALFLSQAWFDKRDMRVAEDIELIICMGETQSTEFAKLAAYLFQQFPAPLLKVGLQLQDKGVRVQVQRRDFFDATACAACVLYSGTRTCSRNSVEQAQEPQKISLGYCHVSGS